MWQQCGKIKAHEIGKKYFWWRHSNRYHVIIIIFFWSRHSPIADDFQGIAIGLRVGFSYVIKPPFFSRGRNYKYILHTCIDFFALVFLQDCLEVATSWTAMQWGLGLANCVSYLIRTCVIQTCGSTHITQILPYHVCWMIIQSTYVIYTLSICLSQLVRRLLIIWGKGVPS